MCRERLQETGSVDTETSKKIKVCVKNDNWNRPSHKAGEFGDFIQLPPSAHYRRYLVNYDANGVMSDNWGLSKTIEMLKKAAEKWTRKGNTQFSVGDISKYNGGNFPPHSSHKNGKGADVWHVTNCDLRKSVFNKSDALELAEAFVEAGAERVLFNCKYVVDKCAKAFAIKGHEHHFHIDSEAGTTKSDISQECKYCNKSIYDACDYKEKAARKEEELTK